MDHVSWEIMDHVSWSRHHTALYHLQLAKILNPDGASAQLASSSSSAHVDSWQDINQLKHFTCAFLVDNELKRSTDDL